MNLQMNLISATAAGNNPAQAGGAEAGAAAGSGFGNLLVQLIGAGGTANVNLSRTDAVALLAQLTGSLPETSGASKQTETGKLQDGAELSLEELVRQFVEWLNSEAGQAFAQSPDMSSWMNEAQALLASLTASPDAASAAGGEGRDGSVDPAGKDNRRSTADIRLLLAQLTQMSEKLPKHEALNSLGQSFRQLVQPVLEQLNQQGRAGFAEQGGNAEPDGSLSDTPRMTVLTAAQAGLFRRGAYGAAENKPVWTGADSLMGLPVAVETSAQHKLSLLAARSMLPFGLTVQAEPQAEAAAVDAAPAENGNQSTGTGTFQDLVRSLTSGHEAKAPAKEVNASAFVREMTDMVVKQMKLTTGAGGLTEARISLIPEHLGQVDVKISVHNGQLVAQFVADSMHGKEMIESQLSQLRIALQSTGLQIDKLEVTQQSAFGSNMFQEQRQQQSSRQFTQDGRKNRESDELPADFDLSLLSLTEQAHTAAGSAFNATA